MGESDEDEENSELHEEDTHPEEFVQIEPESDDDDNAIVPDRELTKDEASACLCMLGRDETGSRYAYVRLIAVRMRLTDVRIILDFKHLQYVDLSHNYLDEHGVRPITRLPYLVSLKLDHNRCQTFTFQPVNFLQILDLNRNRIENLDDINQPKLHTLILSRNPISHVQFDDEFVPELKQLEICTVGFPDFSGHYPKSLQRLFLASNKIRYFESTDLGKLENLEILHVRDNRIRKLDGFTSTLRNLNYLNLRNNKINKLRQFRKLQCLPKLQTLIITGNPCFSEKIAKNDEEEAEEAEVEGEESEEKFDDRRLVLIFLLPNLKRINKTPVTIKEINEVKERRKHLNEWIMNEESSEDEDVDPEEEMTIVGEVEDEERGFDEEEDDED